jgi:hypothetical protein
MRVKRDYVLFSVMHLGDHRLWPNGQEIEGYTKRISLLGFPRFDDVNHSSFSPADPECWSVSIAATSAVQSESRRPAWITSARAKKRCPRAGASELERGHAPLARGKRRASAWNACRSKLL